MLDWEFVQVRSFVLRDVFDSDVGLSSDLRLVWWLESEGQSTYKGDKREFMHISFKEKVKNTLQHLQIHVSFFASRQTAVIGSFVLFKQTT